MYELITTGDNPKTVANTVSFITSSTILASANLHSKHPTSDVKKLEKL
jgi:hypothetical protein